MQHHQSASNTNGVLRSSLDAYFQCVPLVDVQGLTNLLEGDITIWQDSFKKAQEATELLSKNFEKLLEEQKTQLESFVRDSQVLIAESREDFRPLDATYKFRQSGGSFFPIKLRQLGRSGKSTENLHQGQMRIPKIKRSKLTVFGRDDLKCENEFPTLEELPHLPIDKEIRLRKIYYKNGFGTALKAIRLEFTYGLTSPLFEVQDSKYKLKSVELDPTRSIRKIAMSVCDSKGELRGLRLID